MAGRVERLLHAVDTPHEDHRLRAITKLARLVPTLDANDGRIVFNADFLNVHRDHIQVIAPFELTHKN